MADFEEGQGGRDVEGTWQYFLDAAVDDLQHRQLISDVDLVLAQLTNGLIRHDYVEGIFGVFNCVSGRRNVGLAVDRLINRNVDQWQTSATLGGGDFRDEKRAKHHRFYCFVHLSERD